MTKVRAYAVCEDSLYKIALKHNFSDFLYLGKSERTSDSNKKAILADCVEAVIAAIYLDSNSIEETQKFILANIKEQIEFASKNVGLKDYKTFLQEKLQVHGEVLIKYEIIKEEGPDHNKIFNVALKIGDKVVEKGSGKTKKAAEQEAAYKTILKIRAGK